MNAGPPCIPEWRWVPVISGHTVARVLAAGDGEFLLSLDLGRTQTSVVVDGDTIVLRGGRAVPKADLAGAVSSDEDCVLVGEGGCRKIYIFCDETSSYYKLFQPFEDRPPTIVINSATMHAIVGKDPWQDETEKVSEVPARAGECLDTCCGLGYSAQLLSQAGFHRVTTCEVDPNVLEVAAANPWSEGLFGDPRIEIVPADVRGFVGGCDEGRFSCVFHDPPTVHHAGDLYAESLYRDFARVLRPGGVMYHYVGTPGARAGRDYARGVIRRMRAAGFGRLGRVAGGVLGIRGR
jgi:predicted methyltransferase